MSMDGLMGFNRYEWKYNGDLTGDVTLEIRFDLAGDYDISGTCCVKPPDLEAKNKTSWKRSQ